jgi:hypothetical protein
VANVYVRSGAAGAGTGADWANAYTTLAAAFTAKSAGDVFYVSEDHAETQASAMTCTSPGTNASPCFVYCVNHSGSVPPVSADLRATATVTTTGANALSLMGSVYFYGIIFSAASGAVSSNFSIAGAGAWQKYENCALRIGGTSGGNFLVGTASSEIEWLNTTVQVGAVGSTIFIRGSRFEWKGPSSSVTGATIPTTLITPSSAGYIFIEGVDLSAVGSGKTLFGASSNISDVRILKDCRINASVTVAATPTGVPGARLDLIRCDSGAVNYRSERSDYLGAETTETTIVLTGGASDGTTTIARKIVTTANAKPGLPFKAMPLVIWNDTAGSSVTVTVQGIWGGGAVPNNDDIWMDAEYLGNASYPLGSLATCGKADLLAAGSGLASGTGTWGGSTTKFSLAVTITPQMKGPITCYIRAGKASSTFYIDPKITLT